MINRHTNGDLNICTCFSVSVTPLISQAPKLVVFIDGSSDVLISLPFFPYCNVFAVAFLPILFSVESLNYLQSTLHNAPVPILLID